MTLSLGGINIQKSVLLIRIKIKLETSTCIVIKSLQRHIIYGNFNDRKIYGNFNDKNLWKFKWHKNLWKFEWRENLLIKFYFENQLFNLRF